MLRQGKKLKWSSQCKFCQCCRVFSFWLIPVFYWEAGLCSRFVQLHFHSKYVQDTIKRSNNVHIINMYFKIWFDVYKITIKLSSFHMENFLSFRQERIAIKVYKLPKNLLSFRSNKTSLSSFGKENFLSSRSVDICSFSYFVNQVQFFFTLPTALPTFSLIPFGDSSCSYYES